jgi:dihydroorotate dehydrogenase (NAD+) catalytic subunit
MVWQVANAVKIPVCGMGGISTAEDAIEIMMAGAQAVQVGAAIFRDPYAPVKIIDGMNEWCDRNGVKSINEIVGTVKPY